MATRVARKDSAVKHSFLLATVLIAATACAHPRPSAPAAAVTPSLLVVVVRHGEKAPAPANDPVLSEAGIARAAALDAELRRLPITDVVVTQLQRTSLTAAPFIRRSSATVHVVPVGADGVPAHAQAVADTVRAIMTTYGHTGVLVVGHSNTVTPIIQALGGPAMPALCDSQYSRLFTLRGGSGSEVTLQRSNYGAADAVDASCNQLMGR